MVHDHSVLIYLYTSISIFFILNGKYHIENLEILLPYCVITVVPSLWQNISWQWSRGKPWKKIVDISGFSVYTFQHQAVCKISHGYSSQFALISWVFMFIGRMRGWAGGCYCFMSICAKIWLQCFFKWEDGMTFALEDTLLQYTHARNPGEFLQYFFSSIR